MNTLFGAYNFINDEYIHDEYIHDEYIYSNKTVYFNLDPSYNPDYIRYGTNIQDHVFSVIHGNIFNKNELIEYLNQKKIIVSIETELNEIISLLYTLYGIDFVKYINGEFSLFIYDENKSKLFLVRDYLGTKPIYYYSNNSTFRFGTAIKSIYQQDNAIPRKLDMNSINYYLNLGLVPTPQTLYKDIFKLDPGHYLEISKNGYYIKKYWDIPIGNANDFDSNKLDDYSEELSNLLSDAVSIRLDKSDPTGCYLSGGVDSSIVSSFAQKYSEEKIINYNFTFSNEINSNRDESRYSRLLSESNNSDYRQLVYEDSSFYLFEKSLDILEEPTINIFNAQTFFSMSKAVNNHGTKTVLMGEGSDEIFGGYYFNLLEKINFQIHNTNDVTLYRFLPGRENLAFKQYVSYHNIHNHMINLITEKFGIFLPYLLEPYLQRSYILEQKLPLVFNFDSSLHLDKFDNLKNNTEINNFDKSRYADISTRVYDYIIPTRTKINEHNNVDCRFPFFDHRVIEFASRIPNDILIENFDLKHFLKYSTKNLIPETILKRKKHGLVISSEIVISDHKLLTKENIDKFGLFSYAGLSLIIKEYSMANKPYLKFSLGTIIERVLAVQILADRLSRI